MRNKRHTVVRIPWPPDFTPAAPNEIPPSIVLIPRIALGEAAAVAVRLNAQEMAKPAGHRNGWFLAVKAMDRCQLPLDSVPANGSTDDESATGKPAATAGRGEGNCPICGDVRLVDGFCVRCQQSFDLSSTPLPPSPDEG